MALKENNCLQTIKFLNYRLQNDNISCYGFLNERNQLSELLLKATEFGESNSVFIVGPRKCGKSTILLNVLHSIVSKDSIANDIHLIYLNGIVDTDDRITLKTITKQLQLESLTNGKVFGSFAENFAFLLKSLKFDKSKTSKSVIFILDEVDLFCSHRNQTLLYNLFDAVQSRSVPICVIGITCRLDVIELLEKRVKSRFSHRQIFVFPSVKDRRNLIQEFLLLPTNEISFRRNFPPHFCNYFKSNNLNGKDYLSNLNKQWITQWNRTIMSIFDNTEIQSLLPLSLNPFLMLKHILLELSSNYNADSDLASKLSNQLRKYYTIDQKQILMRDISIVEICLLIAVKHHNEIYDRDPFNFEMLLNRMKNNIKSELSDRYFALRGYQNLKNLEIIVPLDGVSTKLQTEYQMQKVTLTNNQLSKIVAEYPNLPTDIAQWASNSWN